MDSQLQQHIEEDRRLNQTIADGLAADGFGEYAWDLEWRRGHHPFQFDRAEHVFPAAEVWMAKHGYRLELIPPQVDKGPWTAIFRHPEKPSHTGTSVWPEEMPDAVRRALAAAVLAERAVEG